MKRDPKVLNVTIQESVLANQISRGQTAILVSKIILVFQTVKIANVTKLDRPHSNVHWEELAIARSDTQGLNVQNAPKTTSETKMIPVKRVIAMTSVLHLHNANPTVSVLAKVVTPPKSVIPAKPTISETKLDNVKHVNVTVMVQHPFNAIPMVLVPARVAIPEIIATNALMSSMDFHLALLVNVMQKALKVPNVTTMGSVFVRPTLRIKSAMNVERIILIFRTVKVGIFLRVMRIR